MIDKFIHLLKEFPGSFLLAVLFVVVLIPYVNYSIPFLERLLDLFAGGILTSVIGGATKRTNVNADTVQTDTLNTDSMNDAQIQTGSITTKET